MYIQHALPAACRACSSPKYDSFVRLTTRFVRVLSIGRPVGEHDIGELLLGLLPRGHFAGVCVYIRVCVCIHRIKISIFR